MQLGVIGIGNMGLGMALRLLERGHPVTVHDLRPEPMAQAMAHGARAQGSAASLADCCDAVVVLVVDAAQVDAVLFGPGGVVHAAHKPEVVVLCPTIGPDDVVRAAGQLAHAGIQTLEAPVSGGPVRARDGSMSLMLAGPDALVQRHLGWLGDASAAITRVGERLGDGARTKLVNNLIAAANLAAAAEAMALARRVGLDPQRTLALIDRSSGQSWIGHDRLARRLAGDTAIHAHMRLLAKDSGLAMSMAAQAGMAPVVGGAAAERFAAACRAGLEGADDGALLDWFGQQAEPVPEHAPTKASEPLSPGGLKAS